MSDEEKKSERYNTVFLVSQIKDQQERNKKIGIAVAVLIVAIILWFLFLKEPAPPDIPHNAAPASAPAAAPASAPK